jgi:uncharacterized membrane protein
MANLVAIAYDDLDQAKQVMGTLGEPEKEHGIDDDFMRDLGQKLPEVSKFGGHVIQSSLSNDQETALQEALDSRGAAA